MVIRNGSREESKERNRHIERLGNKGALKEMFLLVNNMFIPTIISATL